MWSSALSINTLLLNSYVSSPSTVETVADRSSAELHVAILVPTPSKYLNDVHVVVPGTVVCVSEFEMFVNGTFVLRERTKFTSWY